MESVKPYVLSSSSATLELVRVERGGHLFLGARVKQGGIELARTIGEYDVVFQTRRGNPYMIDEIGLIYRRNEEQIEVVGQLGYWEEDFKKLKVTRNRRFTAQTYQIGKRENGSFFQTHSSVLEAYFFYVQKQPIPESVTVTTPLLRRMLGKI